MDDTLLAGRFATGDEDGFAEVFTTFRGPVFGMAVTMLADPGLAEEAVQQAFIGLWRGRDRYDPSRDLAAWVFTVARRAAIDVYRRERRSPTPADAPDAPDTAVEPVSAERLWEAWQVRRAVEELPEDEAAVVRLAHFFQMSQSEIAVHLDVPVGTVKSRSHRAHRKLAVALTHLKDDKPGDPDA